MPTQTSIRPCDETCPDYRPQFASDATICARVGIEVIPPYCRFDFPPIALSSPSCTGRPKDYCLTVDAWKVEF
jgi:hypothetical protein